MMMMMTFCCVIPNERQTIVSRLVFRINVSFALNAGLCMCCAADIDECHDNVSMCPRNSTCVNTNGGFLCKCSRGFKSRGIKCLGQSRAVHIYE